MFTNLHRGRVVSFVYVSVTNIAQEHTHSAIQKKEKEKTSYLRACFHGLISSPEVRSCVKVEVAVLGSRP